MKILYCLIALSLFACQKNQQVQSHEQQEMTQKQIWQCPMHPQVLREHQEPCPICGMKLVQVKESKTKVESAQSSPTLEIEPAVIQKTGVRIIRAQKDSLSENLNGFGSTVLNENGVQILALRVKSFVTSVAISNVGDKVQKGQLLAKVYSPEWAQALSEIQIAQKGNPALAGENSMLTSAVAKAGNLGLDPSWIKAVANGTNPPSEIAIYSPLSGTILDKFIVKGQSLESGSPLFRIADLSKTWLVAEFPQSALAKINNGARAEVRFDADPNRVMSARIVEVLPELTANRNLRVRLTLDRVSTQIKIGQSAKVAISVQNQTGIYIPEQSLIASGDKNLVIVALGQGKFRIKEVLVGLHGKGRVQILQGLAEGDQIVESAQFLLDSESNLQSAVQSFGQGDSHAAPAH